eukprot:TRINITY_DN4731_c0_g1_i1.p1 TRINITY_DN4731_c0_g1~~TRINITY_DN4731_c0_g1_i1.p1  ORF type:complete len:209 (-),score=46.81 TRINITY_DN4731_c0_g1_i1:711-1337(-)
MPPSTRKRLSVGEKREIIKKVREKQWTRADVAEKYEVNEVGYQDISPTQLKNIKTTTLATAMTMMNQVWSDFNAQTIKNCWSHCQILPESMQSTIARSQQDDSINDFLDSNDYFTRLDTLVKVAAQFSNDNSKFIPMTLVLENETQTYEQTNEDENKPAEEDMSNHDSNEYEEDIGKEITSALYQLKDRMASRPKGHEIMMKRMMVFM